ncbi:MAG: hypothetical protein AAF750_10610 [Planctomycetota bacterium]
MSVFAGPVVDTAPRRGAKKTSTSRTRWYERPVYRYPLWALLSIGMVALGLWLAGMLWSFAQSVDTSSILTWFLVTGLAFMPVIMAMAGCALPVLVAMRFRDRMFRRMRQEPPTRLKVVVWVWALTQLILLNAVMLYAIVQFR